MLVNSHADGVPAHFAPVMHLTPKLRDAVLDLRPELRPSLGPDTQILGWRERWSTLAVRIDYLDDPNAPEANSVVPSSNVIVVNAPDEILLIRRTNNNNNWA